MDQKGWLHLTCRIEKAEEEVTMLRLLVAEQSNQIKILTELGHYSVQAHFALRAHHRELAEQHRNLIGALSTKGLVESKDIKSQERLHKKADRLCAMVTDPNIAVTFLLSTGLATARCLLSAAPRFSACLRFAMEAVMRDQPPDDISLEDGAGRDSKSWGFLALMQETWQHNVLANSISSAMGPDAFKHFKAVSRAGRECMRTGQSRTALGKSRDLIVSATAALKPPPHTSPPEQEMSFSSRSWCPPLERRKVEEDAETSPEVTPEPGNQTLALLHCMWQDSALAEALKGSMGAGGVRAFRAVSRGGCECMRSTRERPTPAEGAGASGAQEVGRELAKWAGAEEGGRCAASDELRSFRRRAMASPPASFATRTRGGQARSSAEFSAQVGVEEQRHRSSPSGERGASRQDLVRVCGLVVRSDLNGTVGKVVLRGTTRWRVALPNGESIRVRPENTVAVRRRRPPGSSYEAVGQQQQRPRAPQSPSLDSWLEEDVFTNPTCARAIGDLLGAPWIYSFASTARFVWEALAATGKIYICGGVGANQVLRSVECFDLAKGQWLSIPPAPMNRPRGGAATCMAGGILFMCGGSDGNGWLNTLERFDPWLNDWKVLPSMKTARIYAAILALRGLLYICGGHTLHNVPIAAVERFDPKQHAWKEVQSMMDRRTVPMAAVVNSQIYVYGGVDNEYLRSAERFDPDADCWQPLPPMAFCRGYAGSCMSRGHIYVCGGTGHAGATGGACPGGTLRSSQTQELRACERYSVRRNCWEELPPLRAKRSGCWLAARNSGLFCAGGAADGCPSVEFLDLARRLEWEAVGPNEKKTWTFGFVTAVADQIYIIGGRRSAWHDQGCSDALLSSMVRYSMANNTWDQLPPLKEARIFAGGFHSIV